MRTRAALTTLAIGLAAAANATWVVKDIHPAGQTISRLMGGGGTQQVGHTEGNAIRAARWSGTAASFVDLNPSWATSSEAKATNGSIQVGYASASGGSRAVTWTGTAVSATVLSLSANWPSSANAIDGNNQFGWCTVSGQTHAAKWSGTSGSFVDLHPAGCNVSVIDAAGGGKQGGNIRLTGQNYVNAAMWSGTAASVVNLHPAEYKLSKVYGMSATDQVGEVMEMNGSLRAALWTGSASSFVNLHPGSAGMSSAFASIGEYQVGDYTVDDETNAVIWQGSAESMINLGALLPAGYASSHATAIWRHDGKLFVGGYAFHLATSKSHAVVWEKADPNSFSFSLNKTQVAGQNSVQGTIVAPTATPQPRVYAVYDNSSLVTTPGTVTLPANTTTKNFQITTTAVNSQINTIVYARYGNITLSVPLALVPLVPTALAFNPTQVAPGSSLTCRVVINGVAGPSGRTIAILDNSPHVTVPSTVTVPPGATQVTFTITTLPSAPPLGVVTITARVSAGEKTGTFRFLAP